MALRSSFAFSAIAAALLGCEAEPFAAAQEQPQLLPATKIKDLFGHTITSSATAPSSYVVLGSSALMFTSDGQLFRTDGTTQGTSIVSDLTSAPDPGTPISVYGGHMYWRGKDRALWRSDGTGQGTRWFWHSSNGAVLPPFVVGTTLYFGADQKLYRSDGTAAGTTPIANIVQVGPGYQIGLRGYFQCLDAQGAMALCVTDGTSAGTRVHVSLAPAGNLTPRLLGAHGNIVWFTRSSGETGPRGVWAVDVMAASVTEIVAPAAVDVLPRTFRTLATRGDFVFFPCVTPAAGLELCRSAGTAATTSTIDINPGADSSSPEVTSLGDRLVLRAYRPDVGYELFSSDGTLAGTTLITELIAGPQGGVAETRLVAAGDHVYFGAVGTAGRYDLARSNGTAAGTSRIMPLGLRHFASSDPMLGEAIALGTKLVFTGAGDFNDLEPWISDGTIGGTSLLRDLRFEYENMRHGGTFHVSNRACFSVRSVSNGTYLFAIQEPLENTGDVGIRADLPVATPSMLYTFEEGEFPDTLRKTDCSTAAVAVTSLPANVVTSATLGDRLVFTDASNRLWFSDGTQGQTVASQAWTASSVDKAGPSLWLRSADRLLVSDGTEATTKVVHTFSGVRAMRSFTSLGEQVVFVVDDAIHGAELWRVNATGTNAELVAELAPGARGSNPRQLFVLRGEAYFAVDIVADAPAQLWKTNGTSAGTVRVKDIEPVGPAVVWGNYAFFPARGPNGRELWRTDGTEAGTLEVTDIFEGPQSSNPGGLFLVGEKGPLFFAAEHPQSGRELWQLAEAEADAELAVDVAAGPLSSHPSVIFARGTSAYIYAVSEELGSLWSVRLPPEAEPLPPGEEGCGCTTRAPLRGALVPIALVLVALASRRRRPRGSQLRAEADGGQEQI